MIKNNTSLKLGSAAIMTILFSLFVISACQPSRSSHTSAVSKGVSDTLAQYRKEILSDIVYTIHLDIPAEKDSAIWGTETIVFDLKDDAIDRALQLDFKVPTGSVHQLVVNNQGAEPVLENEHLIIDASYLKKGENRIQLTFRAGDLSLNRNDEYLYTLLVPDRARTLFPCFDQPDLKAVFELSLTLPRNWVALSNAAIQDSTLDGDQKNYKFSPSDTLSTYLFSFAAGKFQSITRTLDGRQMTFFHRETDAEKIAHSIDSIFILHQQALAFLETYTGIPYPFQKFDFIAIPDFQYGGMEHVGAIQYRAASLFLDAGATLKQQRSRANLIAHETAHMWFGDLVTMRWFDDVWTKEVFANFMADKIAEKTTPDQNFNLKFLIDHVPAAYGIDRTQGANAIRQPLANLQHAGTLYGDIIYHKSPVMMRQLEKLMGEEAFQIGLQTYLKNYAYSNASWPELIEILDENTSADLKEWNEVWVNEAGRPRFQYHITYKSNQIEQLTLSQEGEDGSDRIWPQYLEIALVYPNRVDTVPVYMDQTSMRISAVEGRERPIGFVFNSSGEGYGLFPVDLGLLEHVDRIADPLMRASLYIHLYENLWDGQSPTPMQVLHFYQKQLPRETEELCLGILTGQLQAVYWKMLSADQRRTIAADLEATLWKTMEQQTTSSAKKLLFKTYTDIVQSELAQQRLYGIWQRQQAPEGVSLTEEDYSSLALALLVRDHAQSDSIAQQQLERIANPDRKKRFAFILPAVSRELAKRDQFFESLKDPKNREKEAWVATALSYLHHPLRVHTSEKYLKASLELLEEVQQTGDIFFPTAWLQSTFSAYQSPSAWQTVDAFLRAHPQYNPKLKAKILQAVDGLRRHTSI